VGPAWWQSFINTQLNELLNHFASAYTNDVLIYSNENKPYFDYVKKSIFRLYRAGLQSDIRKSSFNVTVIDYLGIILKAGKGINIDPSKL